MAKRVQMIIHAPVADYPMEPVVLIGAGLKIAPPEIVLKEFARAVAVMIVLKVIAILKIKFAMMIRITNANVVAVRDVVAIGVLYLTRTHQIVMMEVFVIVARVIVVAVLTIVGHVIIHQV